MNSAAWYGLVGAGLCGIGLYGLIVHPHALRKILSFNLLGAGVFLIAGVVARRGAAAGFPGDPVLQGLVITGIIVAFAATAVAVALLLRFAEAAGTASLAADALARAQPSQDPAPAAEDATPAPAGPKR
jgi:multicomponent Na+:H+ antiporter subunit C